jgi:hypothetical protein
VVGGLAFTAAAVAALADLWAGDLSFWDDSGPGASFFPLILAFLLAVLGLVFVFKRSQALPAEEDDAGAGFARPQTIKFVLLVVALILLFSYLGGLLSLGIFVIAEMHWVERARMRMSLATGAITFIAVWLIFVKLLSVPLPLGILPDMFG